MQAASELLLVEDEIPLQDLLQTILAEAGFEVFVAGNGMRALTNLKAEPRRFKALITDINLGRGPDGWHIAKFARAAVPDMPVLYMTGGNAHEWPSNGVSRSVLITKPFTIDKFLSTVSELLTPAKNHLMHT